MFRCETSDIWVTIERFTGIRRCAKIFDRCHFDSRSDEKNLWKELTLLREAQKHGNVVEVLNILEEQKQVFVVMELAPGGSVLSRVMHEGALTEPAVQKIAYSVLQGILYLEKKGICHNDIEPANLLLDANGSVLITDFGNAFHLSSPPSANEIANENYAAPEVLRGRLPSIQSDIWSVGLVLCFCLLGHSPFTQDRGTKGFLTRIRTADYLFGNSGWSQVSRIAKQLISNLIQVDPSVRFNPMEALLHPWMNALEAPEPPEIEGTNVRRPSFRPMLRYVVRKLMCQKDDRVETAKKELPAKGHSTTAASSSGLGSFGLYRSSDEASF